MRSFPFLLPLLAVISGPGSAVKSPSQADFEEHKKTASSELEQESPADARLMRAQRTITAAIDAHGDVEHLPLSLESKAALNGSNLSCEWTLWTDWSECLPKCSSLGQWSRSRHNSDCQERQQNTTACEPTPCTMDCLLGDWQPWTACSSEGPYCLAGWKGRVRNQSAPSSNDRCLASFLADEKCCASSGCLTHDPCAVINAAGEWKLPPGTFGFVGHFGLGVSTPQVFAKDTIVALGIVDCLSHMLSLMPNQFHLRLTPKDSSTVIVTFALFSSLQEQVTSAVDTFTNLTNTSDAVQIFQEDLSGCIQEAESAGANQTANKTAAAVNTVAVTFVAPISKNSAHVVSPSWIALLALLPLAFRRQSRMLTGL